MTAARTDLTELADRIAAQARSGEEIEVFVGRGRTTSVKAYRGAVESFTSADTSGIGIRVVVDHRQGFAHAGSLEEAVVIDTLAEARDNATFGQPDEHYGLARPDGVEPTPIDLWRDELAATGTDRKIALAIELERAVNNADPRITGVRSAGYGDRASEAAVATSTGIAVWSRATSCYLSVVALASSGDETQVGSGVDVGRRPDELDVTLAAGDAVERATRLLGARKAATQRTTVVLEPRLTATLLGIVGSTLTGDTVCKGRSPFADRMGEPIASPLLSFVDDPTDSRSFGADSHDGEGLATRRNSLVEGGALRGFLHNSYTGRRSRAASTGSAVRGVRSIPGVGLQALAVVPGDRSPEVLLAGIERGLLVQSMNGLHSGVNRVSGDFSVGAEGLMIRNGALAEPVCEVTLASTLQRMLADIDGVGDDLEWLPGGTGAVTLVIRDVSLSGT